LAKNQACIQWPTFWGLAEPKISFQKFFSDESEEAQMENLAFVISTSAIVLIFVGPAISQPGSDINAKVAQLDIGKATIDDVVRIFGEPEKYFRGRETFTKDNLPSTYMAAYPGGFFVFMSGGKVSELRFEEPGAGYVFRGKLKLGSSLGEVLEVLGQPAETVVGEELGVAKDGVLYKDINGRKGHCYYSRKEQGIRLFLSNYNVTALYLTSTAQRGSSETGKTSKDSTLRRLELVESVEEFDDVRNKDLSKLDLSKGKRLIRTLQFNQKTIWPSSENMPVGVDPNQLLTSGMNPGLGVRELHHQGITGKGVNVAIIDQPMYLDHPEFVGKIAAYYDTGCGEESSSMHGPAVTSLLVGTNCGTAPDAQVYYAAAPSWKRDAAYEAKALDWIIQQNENLPISEKIRVVSVSAAPSSPNTRDKNRHMWPQACARAEAAGIMVLDCTEERGFIGKCWYNSRVPESIASCTPGHPKEGAYFPPDHILAPAWGRTVAEESKKGDFGYIYGRGGVSWTIPYCAGVLALGWQIRPDLTPEQMRELLFESAHTKKDGAKIINPKKFIRLVQKAKVVTPTHRR
jgi:serine protease AprX